MSTHCPVTFSSVLNIPHMLRVAAVMLGESPKATGSACLPAPAPAPPGMIAVLATWFPLAAWRGTSGCIRSMYPVDPHRRAIAQVVELVRDGERIAYHPHGFPLRPGLPGRHSGGPHRTPKTFGDGPATCLHGVHRRQRRLAQPRLSPGVATRLCADNDQAYRRGERFLAEWRGPRHPIRNDDTNRPDCSRDDIL